MRKSILLVCLGSAFALAACDKSADAEVERALKDVNVIDESNLNDLMLTSSDPNEAVDYFTRTFSQNPDRIDLARGLGMSLIRAKRPVEAARIWKNTLEMEDATDADRVSYADALIR